MSRPRLVWVSDSPGIYTGLGRVSREILNRLACRNALDITSYGCFGTHREIDPARFPYRIVPGDDAYGRGTLEDLLRREAFDIVVTLGDPWMMDWLVGSEARPSTWIQYLTLDGPTSLSRWDPMFRAATRVVACSEFGVRLLGNHGPAAEMRTIPLGVDVQAFRPADAEREGLRARFGMGGRFVVGCVARNQPRKQFPLLIRAFRKFLAERPGAVLYMHTAPQDPAGSDLADLVEAEGLADHVGFTCGITPLSGIVDQDLCTVYNLLDVFALPTMGEGFGLPILEAMACGVPVVATDCSAVTELVQGRGELICAKDRLLVGPYNIEQVLADVDHLVEILCKLHDSPGLRAEYGVSGQWPGGASGGIPGCPQVRSRGAGGDHFCQAGDLIRLGNPVP